jgi:hypothetical protein
MKRAVLLIILIGIIGCGSHTGLVQYNPLLDEGFRNVIQEKHISVAILNIPDRRPDSKGKENMIGTIYGGYKNPIKRIYSNQTINLDVMDALESLLNANGCTVHKYPELSDCLAVSEERFAIKGKINKFWTEAYNLKGAVVDIDLQIFDVQNKKFIWSGKIEKFQKRGVSGGILTDPKGMVAFLNETFKDAIDETWYEGGMKFALLQEEKMPTSNTSEKHHP